MQFHVSSSSSAIETPAEFKALSQSDGSSLTLAMIDDAYKGKVAVYQFYMFAVVEASTQVKTASQLYTFITYVACQDDIVRSTFNDIQNVAPGGSETYFSFYEFSCSTLITYEGYNLTYEIHNS
jgi:hypothetical protein